MTTLNVIDANTGKFVPVDLSNPSGTVYVNDYNTGNLVPVALGSGSLTNVGTFAKSGNTVTSTELNAAGDFSVGAMVVFEATDGTYLALKTASNRWKSSRFTIDNGRAGDTRTTLLSGLISAWTMNDASDSHGISDATFNGLSAPSQSGAPANGASVAIPNNDTKYVGIPNSENIRFDRGSWEMVSWVRFNSLAQVNMILSKMGGGASTLWFYVYNGHLKADLWDFSTPIATVEITDLTIESGVWYMVTVGYNADTNDFRITCNANHQSLSTATSSPLDSESELQLGSSVVMNTTMNGSIGTTLRYSRVLSNDELVELYNSGAGKAYPFLDGDTLSTTVDGTGYRILVPTNHLANSSYPLIVWFHGAGGDQYSFSTDAAFKGIRNALLGEGYMLASSSQGGSHSWGNEACLQSVDSLLSSIAQNYTISQLFTLGQSMGGIGALTYAQRTVPDGLPKVTGVLGIYPACSLEGLWEGGAGMWASDLRSAYGIGNDADFYTRTNGYDPIRFLPNEYAGVNFILFASAADTMVIQENNSDVFRDFINGSAPCTLVQCVGEHGDYSHYQVARYTSFFNSLLV